jgi:predicted LPLAT superfamily acyltransferase
MTSNWKQEKERGSKFLILVIRWIALHLGRGIARLILYPITAYFLLRASSSVSASRDFLNRTAIYKPNWWNIARHIHCFASTILDRVFFLTGQFERFDIQIHNLNILHDHMSPQQGCILLGSHHGSFEVLRALNFKKYKTPLKVLMYPQHNAFMTQVLESLNPSISESVIPLGQPDTMIKAMEYYQQGNAIGILGDRASANDKHVDCVFFGDLIKIPTGPFQLALTLKSTIILFFGLYRGANHYDIYFELLTPMADYPRNQRQQAIQQMSQQYVTKLESYVKKSPFNWFNFYRYWL